MRPDMYISPILFGLNSRNSQPQVSLYRWENRDSATSFFAEELTRIPGLSAGRAVPSCCDESSGMSSPGLSHGKQVGKNPPPPSAPLKVPKCEIFERSDFHDFYTIKSVRKGDFKNLKKYLAVNLGLRNSLCICSGAHVRSEVPSKHADHTHQWLTRSLSIGIRNWCACWAYASVLCAYAQHKRKIPNLKRAFKPCWTYALGTDACTEHVRRELMRMMSVRAPYAYAQFAHQKLNEACLPPKLK